MRYACSVVAFIDGGLSFGLSSIINFLICLSISLSVSSEGFSRRFRFRSSARDLADAGRVGWKCRMRPAGMMRPQALFTDFLKVFSASSTVLFSLASATYSSLASATYSSLAFA